MQRLAAPPRESFDVEREHNPLADIDEGELCSQHLSMIILRLPGTMSLIDCPSLADSLVHGTIDGYFDRASRLYCWNWNLHNSFLVRRLSSRAASFLLLLRVRSFDGNLLLTAAAVEGSNNFRRLFLVPIDSIELVGKTALGAMSSLMSLASAIAVSKNFSFC